MNANRGAAKASAAPYTGFEGKSSLPESQAVLEQQVHASQILSRACSNPKNDWRVT
jgi:hypothetical protein